MRVGGDNKVKAVIAVVVIVIGLVFGLFVFLRKPGVVSPLSEDRAVKIIFVTPQPLEFVTPEATNSATTSPSGKSAPKTTPKTSVKPTPTIEASTRE